MPIDPPLRDTPISPRDAKKIGGGRRAVARPGATTPIVAIEETETSAMPTRRLRPVAC